MDFKTRKWIITNNTANKTFEVTRIEPIEEESSLDTIWEMVSNLFFLGSNVTITNENGEARTYIK